MFVIAVCNLDCEYEEFEVDQNLFNSRLKIGLETAGDAVACRGRDRSKVADMRGNVHSHGMKFCKPSFRFQTISWKIQLLFITS